MLDVHFEPGEVLEPGGDVRFANRLRPSGQIGVAEQ